MMAGNAKILFVAPSAYTLGGLSTWLDYLLPGLNAEGWDVTLGLVAGPRHHQPDRYLHVHPFKKTVSIDCPDSTPAGRIRSLRRTIQHLAPNVVLSVNIPDAIRAAAMERCRGRDTRAVMTCHGIQEDLFADMKRLRDELDAVVCTNRLACRLATELGEVPEDRVFHCAYGTHVPPLLPQRSPNPVFTIGYSGRLEQPQKRIHDLIEIAIRLRRAGRVFRFLVAGTGPEQEMFLSRVEQCDLSAHFEFLGFLQPTELNDKLYLVCDALIVTSSWETGPIVIWESMAAGTPVISSRYTGSGLEGLLHHKQNCMLFDVANVDAAAEQIIAIEDQLRLRDQIRQNAFQTVTEKLSCEVSVANWSRILNALIQMTPKIGEIHCQLPPSGRLDPIVGHRIAGFVRKMVRHQPPDNGPGGEWPHTLSGSKTSHEAFLVLAGERDHGESPRK
ncbi:Glycogen synthase [Stieleria varia]|uniref:Glycogen synthase n=2 Tax=Stieleria varia TaxID=2528005 RepID=A0A5C6B230_9BACT|nr:Glycogen synthase [Stieleria varia]